MTRFAKFADATAEGFVIARQGKLQTYRGCIIRSVDVSRPTRGFTGAYGYSFSIEAEIPADIAEVADWPSSVRSSDYFGHGETLWFTDERNAMRQSGCFVQAYSPETYTQAMAAARAWIDQWFASNPDALTRQQQFEIQERERAIRRENKRHARLTAKGLI